MSNASRGLKINFPTEYAGHVLRIYRLIIARHPRGGQCLCTGFNCDKTQARCQAPRSRIWPDHPWADRFTKTKEWSVDSTDSLLEGGPTMAGGCRC
eukprot:939118-Prymnesium_polylepis.2